MKCQNCGFELPEGAKFCKRCGSPQIANPIRTTQAQAITPSPSNKKKRTPTPMTAAVIVLSVLVVALTAAIVVILNKQASPVQTETPRASEEALASARTVETAPKPNESGKETSAPSEEKPVPETDRGQPAIPSTEPATQAPFTDPLNETLDEDYNTLLQLDVSHRDPGIEDYYDDILEMKNLAPGVGRRGHEIPDSAMYPGSFHVGDSQTYLAHDYYDTYYSLDKRIAVVSEKGVITAVAPGVTYIVCLQHFAGTVSQIDVQEVTVSP